MKKHHLGAIAGVLAVVAAIFFVYHRWRTSGFAWKEFLGALRNVDWGWLAAALGLIMLTYLGRALRWEIMLRPLAKHVNLWRVLVATCIGFTAVVLFGRAGEPVRPYLIARNEGVSFSSQVAAWLVERILDLLMVLLIFGIALTQISHSAVQPSPKVRTMLEASGYAAGFAAAASLLLLIALRQFRGQVKDRLLAALGFLPQATLLRITEFLGAFEEGMESTRNKGFIWMLITYTVLEWAVIVASFYCVFRAFPVTAGLRFEDVVFILGFVAFGSVLQIPGVGGGMQIATVVILTEFYGLSLEAATGVALVLWVNSFVAIVPVGLGLAFREGIKWRNLKALGEPSGISV